MSMNHEVRIQALEDETKRLRALLDAALVEVAGLRAVVAAPVALAAKRRAQGTNGTNGDGYVPTSAAA